MIFQYIIGKYSQVLVSNQATCYGRQAKSRDTAVLMHLDHAWLDAYTHYGVLSLDSRGTSLEKFSYRSIKVHHTKQGCFGRLTMRATCCTRNIFKKNPALFEKSIFLHVLGWFCMRALWRAFDWKMPIFGLRSQFLAGSSHAAAIFSNRTYH